MAQQYATDEAGNVWEVDASGNAVRFVSAAQSSGDAVVAPNPMRAAAAQFEAPQAAATLARTRQQYQTEAATAPYDARTAAAQAAKAELEVEKTRRDIQAAQSTANPRQQAAMAALANDEILTAIGKARENLNRTGSAGFAARLPEMIQPQSAIDLAGSLNTIASRLTLDKLAQLKQASPTGASGLGSLTEKEGALLRDSVAGLGQTQSPEQLRENLAAVERHYRNFRALSAGEDYRNPQVAAKYGIAQAPEPQQQMQLATGSIREEADPALRGVNARIRSMIGAGRPAKDIVAYMNSVQPGLGDDKAADVTAATRYHAQNPQVPLDKYAISVENRSVPMSGFRQGLNTAAQLPGGAFVASAADALTANNLTRFADNPTIARAGLDAISSENPISSFLGTAAGGALAGAGIEGALPLRGLGALSRFRQPIADAVYGGVASASDDGTALGGAAEGVAGGYLGRLGTRALGNALRGVRNADVQGLRAEGVTMTPGAILGGKVKAREDRLSGFGGVGDDINARRLQSVQQFNRAAYNQALAPIGKSASGDLGEAAVEQADDAVSQAYREALDGVALQRDRAFGADMQGPTMAANRLPGEMADSARYTLNERVSKSFAPGEQIGTRQERINPNVIGPVPKMGVAPAFLGNDGKVYAGSALGNHFTAITPELREVGVGGAGFVDNTGRFLSREDALSHVRSQGEAIRPSENMGNELDALDYREQSSFARLPPQPEFKDVPVLGPSVMSGNNFQQAIRGLEQDAKAVRNAPYGNDFGNVARGARGALEGLLERQSPGSLNNYLNANAAYRNTSVLADATAAAMNTGGVFTPAQLGQAARANARKFTGRMSAATTDRPFYDLQRAAQNVLPSKVPDSGTAGRTEAGGLFGKARAAARNTVLAPLYAEGTQPLINSALLDRTPGMVSAGDAIARRARLGGLFGAPLLVDYGP